MTAVKNNIQPSRPMELVPTIISLCGFSIAITFVVLVHKVISSEDRENTAKPTTKTAPTKAEEHTSFIHKHASAH